MADSRSYRQQELFLLVAARLAAAASDRRHRRSRRCVIPLDEPDDAGRRSCATRPRAGCRRCITASSTVWDSLAICEYLAETFPEAGLWPADAAARAVRALGQRRDAFGLPPLRQHLPMNIRSASPAGASPPEVQADIDRITRDLARLPQPLRRRQRRFPVRRLHDRRRDVRAGGQPLPHLQHRARGRGRSAYCDAVTALPAMQEWVTAAAQRADDRSRHSSSSRARRDPAPAAPDPRRATAGGRRP